MFKWITLSLGAAALILLLVLFRPSDPNPLIAYPRDVDLHQILMRDRPADTGLVFLGDSLIQRWRFRRQLWQTTFGQYHPLNLGADGETIQGLLWRVDHGEIDGISPKVIVILVGTNNV